MSRKYGSPLTESELEIHVAEDCVLKNKGHRYVFTEVLSPKVHRLSRGVDGSTRLYLRYSQVLHRDMYNTKLFYGLRAVDIDKPQDEERAVSVRLNIIIGEGQDEYKRNF